VRIDLSGKGGPEAQVMAAGPEPERRQLQDLFRQPLFDAVGDAGHQDVSVMVGK